MLVVDCWNDCGADRQIGFGVMGCIPLGAVRAWARWQSLDGEAIRILWSIIRKLDADRVERDAAKRRLETGNS